jgi:hypothetical protein
MRGMNMMVPAAHTLENIEATLQYADRVIGRVSDERR